MRLRTFALVSLIIVAAFVGANITSWKLPYPMPEDAQEGKAVWQKHNCVSCHTLFGNGGYVGDDMTNILKRRTAEDVQRYLTNPPVMRPNREHLHPPLEPGEAEFLTSYLRFVGDIPTLGWPPEPREAKQ
ncbi:cytochrome c [Paradesulfitobacterium aromaticivorans]